MARMIPNFLDPDVKSPGEKEMYPELRDSPDTTDWLVLHSQQVPRHRKKLKGEADFVLVVPGLAVVVVEVKAHSSGYVSDGVWKLGTDPRTSSPFKQASEAMHSLMDDLRNHDPALKRVPFVSLVVFTHMDKPNVHGMQDWHDRELVHAGMIKKHGLVHAIRAQAETCLAALAERRHTTLDEVRIRDEDVEPVVEFFTPRIHLLPNKSTIADGIERELKRTLGSQRKVLAMIDRPDGPVRQYIVDGPAGSGKSLLAREFANTIARRGCRVAYLAYNSLFVDSIAEDMHALSEKVEGSITCRTIDALLREVADARVPSDRAARTTFFAELPSLALEAITDSEPPAFDVLIIDEAQDVIRERYWDVLDLLLDGGWKDGQWYAFGDFENQSIFLDEGELNSLDLIRSKGIQTPEFRAYLGENCRNTARSGELAATLGGLNPGYTNYLRADAEQPKPEIKYYAHEANALELLEAAIADASTTYKPSDIVILEVDPSVGHARELGRRAGRPDVVPFEPGKQGIRYISAARFKGLEAPCIIATGITSLDTPRDRHLLYVAITRSLHAVTLIVADEAKAALNAARLGELDMEHA